MPHAFVLPLQLEAVKSNASQWPEPHVESLVHGIAQN